MSTYNIEFPKWRDEVYRRHGYDPCGWYGAEVAEKMHQEAMRTYIGPAATAKDYLEVQHTQEEDECFACSTWKKSPYRNRECYEDLFLRKEK